MLREDVSSAGLEQRLAHGGHFEKLTSQTWKSLALVLATVDSRHHCPISTFEAFHLEILDFHAAIVACKPSMAHESFLLSTSLSTPQGDAPSHVSLQNGFKLALHGQISPLTGVNFHFMADFMKLRSVLDPTSKIEPLFLSETFYDGMNFPLLEANAFFKTIDDSDPITGDETPRGLSLKFVSQNTDLLTQPEHQSCRFNEFSNKAHIKIWLSRQDLGISDHLIRAFATFHTVSWRMELPSKEYDVSIKLDAMLLPDRRLYDVGSLRIRTKDSSSVSCDSLVLAASEALQKLDIAEFPILNVHAPPKFCAYMGAQSKPLVSPLLDKWAMSAISVRLSDQYSYYCDQFESQAGASLSS